MPSTVRLENVDENPYYYEIFCNPCSLISSPEDSTTLVINASQRDIDFYVLSNSGNYLVASVDANSFRAVPGPLWVSMTHGSFFEVFTCDRGYGPDDPANHCSLLKAGVRRLPVEHFIIHDIP
jgi:hypothetical protein